MNLPRAAFLSHFVPVFQVHCLKLWPKRSKVPPEALPRCLHEWIRTANGHMDLDLPAFREVVWPVIERLHRKTSGARPAPDELTGALYDALSAAGVEITIGPKRHGHGA